MKSVIDIRGDFLSPTSYGMLAREIYYSLGTRLGLPVRLEYVPTTQVQLKEEHQIISQIQASQNIEGSPIKLHLGPPPFNIVPGAVNICWAQHNMAYPNEDLLKAWEQFNMVIVSSAKLCNELRNKVDSQRFFYLPIPVDTGMFNEDTYPLAVLNVTHKLSGEEVDDKPFIFGSVGTWDNKSGIRDIVRSYFTEFSASDKVVLLIKSTDQSRTNNGEGQIKSEIANLRNGVKNPSPPKIYIIPGGSNDNDYSQFIAACDSVVVNSRWDPLHLPIHHGMACNKIVICPSYGGKVEYCSEDICLTTSGEFEKVYASSDRFAGFKDQWFVSSINSICAKMRKAYSAYQNEESFKKKRKKGLEYIEKVCNTDEVMKEFLKVLSHGIKLDEDRMSTLKKIVEENEPLAVS